MTDLEKELVDILFSESYAALATVDADGATWSTPLVFTLNEAREVIWASASESLHSMNLGSSTLVGASIYDSGQPQNSPQGVYLQGTALEVPVGELDQAVADFYRWRYPDPAMFAERARPASEFQWDSPRRLYRLSSVRYWGISRDGHPEHGNLVDYRVEVDIEAAFSLAWAEKFNM